MHGKPEPKTLFLAQIFITFFMSLTMSGFMGLLHMGFTPQFLQTWPRDWIIAWPVAFILTQGFSRLGFKLAFTVRRPKA
ncbi:DUF2798 domain-containing protein [Brevundimonas vesicularis]|uniref:DUF2798 domain-containing protein n=1 Tax=Brevundimonas vesicularis TaxID=41276 RepID=UPI0038D369B7